MIAIKNGKVVTVTGKTFEKGDVLIDGGKIVAVGENLDIPSGAEVIDATGKWVTPGLIDVHTHMTGNSEPGSMGQRGDTNEASSPNTAQVCAADALDPFALSIPMVRSAGFTTVCSLPGSANLVGGLGVTFKLIEANYAKDMIIKGKEHMKFAIGENPRRAYGGQGKMPMTRMGIAAQLREYLRSAKAYSDELLEAEKNPDAKKPKYDAQCEALVPVVRGEMKARIHCHQALDIMTAVTIAEEFNLNFILEHATDSPKVANLLAEKGVTCVIGPLLTGYSKQEIWSRSLHTPAKLEKAGVNICIMADADTKTAWLPSEIGMLMARGLTEQTAFEAVTIRAAKLLDVADRVGSLEVGKDADIAIFNGHPFSNMTMCEKTIINGVVYESTL